MYSDSDYEYDYLIKLLTLGDSNVGKTSLLYQYTENGFCRKFIATVGVDFRHKKIIFPADLSANEGSILSHSNRLHIQLWDTAGQERSLTVAFFRDAMGFILVFDLTDEKSFIHVRDWIELLQGNAYCQNPDTILVGNKADLAVFNNEKLDEGNSSLDTELDERSHPIRRQVTSQRAQQLASELGQLQRSHFLNRIPYFETSAKTGENVDLIMDTLIGMIMKRIERAELEGLRDLPYHRQPLGSQSSWLPEFSIDSNENKSICDC